MIMYREMESRVVGCMSCGVTYPLARLDYRPDGALWCWRCRVAAEIAAHRSGPAESPASQSPDQIYYIAAAICALGLLSLFLFYFAIVAFRC